MLVRGDGQLNGFARAVRSTGTFCVRLNKVEHGKLGLDVEHTENSTVLPIVAIKGGAAEAWNRANPTRALRIGDRILEVNSSRGNLQEMLEVCQRDAILDLVVSRGDSIPSVARPDPDPC